MTVRIADPADEDALLALLYALEADNNTFGDELDEDRIRLHIRLGTERKGGMHGIIDGDGELAGSIGINFDRPWYGKNYMLAQLWLFVRPEYRGRGYEEELIAWAKKMRDIIAEGKPLPIIHTVISEKRLESKLRLWQRQSGSKMIGGIFLIK
jgi:GNAT superfamily N-acetyltransferase